MGEAPPSQYDYGILLDYDPSGTVSCNLLEYFQNILLLTNRIATDPRTFQNLLDDTIYNSLLVVWTLFQKHSRYFFLLLILPNNSCCEA